MHALPQTTTRTRLAARTSVAVAIVLMSVVATVDAQAQAKSYEPFRNDAGIIAAYLPGTGAFGGGAVAEPKFNLTDQWSLGLRTSAVVSGGGSIDGGGGDVSVGMGVSVGILAKAEYFITTSGTRPFVGLGAGVYYLVSQAVDTGGGVSVSQKAGKYFGVAPQLGLQLGGFRLALTYNKIVAADIEVVQSVGGATSSASQDFVSLDLAFQSHGRRLQP